MVSRHWIPDRPIGVKHTYSFQFSTITYSAASSFVTHLRLRLQIKCTSLYLFGQYGWFMAHLSSSERKPGDHQIPIPHIKMNLRRVHNKVSDSSGKGSSGESQPRGVRWRYSAQVQSPVARRKRTACEGATAELFLVYPHFHLKIW